MMIIRIIVANDKYILTVHGFRDLSPARGGANSK
jgi:hypothetical protein